ncbi:MAG TPA: helix-turn-helix domain-containing protein [Armatimonadota bacterium]|jgi:AraC-like DNA-binding protein
MPYEVYPWAFRQDVPFAIFEFDALDSEVLHQHGYFELVIVLDGEGLHCLADGSFPISAGDIFALTGSEAHGYRDVHHLHLVNVLFRPEFTQPIVSLLHQLPAYRALFEIEPTYRLRNGYQSHLHLDGEGLTTVAALVQELSDEYAASLPGYQTMLLLLFGKLVLLLNRYYGGISKPLPSSFFRISTVLSYIDTAYASPITLAELADIAYMSLRNFNKRFKESMGIPPFEYLLQYRIRKGAELLTESLLSITEVATRVGFVDSNYFSRQFKRIMHLTPREYRTCALAAPSSTRG